MLTAEMNVVLLDFQMLAVTSPADHFWLNIFASINEAFSIMQHMPKLVLPTLSLRHCLQVTVTSYSS